METKQAITYEHAEAVALAREYPGRTEATVWHDILEQLGTPSDACRIAANEEQYKALKRIDEENTVDVDGRIYFVFIDGSVLGPAGPIVLDGHIETLIHAAANLAEGAESVLEEPLRAVSGFPVGNY